MYRSFIVFIMAMLAHSLHAQITWGDIDYTGEPWVKNTSRPNEILHGLEGRHITVWASHGRYYDHESGSWQWQRPALFGTNEDLFTQTIVVPYLIPMLENAGAVVFTPRERDWQRHEVIVDNDQLNSLSSYHEQNYHHKWMTAPLPGFALHKGVYHDGENPFEAGTARMAETTNSKNRQNIATYQPNLPESGRYAVYVSYQTVPASIDDAQYIVWHQGKKTEFRVNQQMGGSTWVYLGTFDFDEGSSPDNCVMVTNQSRHVGMVTTDAVRFGGGMGNIDRGGVTSQLPRCLEGARYYAQWAGMPYRVYSSKNGTNDYADDINARSLMLNELCGGSVYAPDSAGRHVPIELSLAIHSDAGYNKPNGQGIYGSLSICTTHHGDSLLAAGTSREMSKELANRLLNNTKTDLQLQYGTWTARDIYDRNYSETRVPIVPSAILETLSHQSFSDMRYGQDPNFRFMLARSVYKTILGYINDMHQLPSVIAPLTPHNFRIELDEKKKGVARISWSPTTDAVEPSAIATDYILYTAEDNSGFDNGILVKGTSVSLKLRPGVLYHFRVAAANSGGQSFPSAVLSTCYKSDKAKTILVVDGFHRRSSPAICNQGFQLDEDLGVSDGLTCGWLGRQQVFDESRIGIEDSTGLGFSSSELAGQFIAGNEGNHVATHAKAIFKAGNYNIVSCSSEAIDRMELYQYHLIDMILGLERNDGHSLVPYKAFPEKTQNILALFAAQGGRLLVSGAYVGTDMPKPEEQLFLAHVLKCIPTGTNTDSENAVEGLGTTFTFHRTPNEHHYAASKADILMPATNEAFCAMAYANGTSAATAYAGHDYKAFTAGFPLECIQNDHLRESIIKGILNFLLQ